MILISPLKDPEESPVPIRTSPLCEPTDGPLLSASRPEETPFPVLKTIEPLFPEPPLFPLSPVLKVRVPETAVPLPPFALAIVMSPLDVTALFPLIKDSLPPVFPSVVVVAPALISISPPVPLFPLPTVTKIDPDRPLEDPPEPIYKAPLLPADATPELILTSPVNVPAAAVAKTMFPLEATAL
jgi:hypothetical protein